MNLKNNKGYVGVDISLAVIMLLIIVPTVMGIVYNLNISKNATNIKADAVSIAVDAIEVAKGLEIKDITVENIINEFCSQYDEGTIRSGDIAIISNDTASYKLSMNVADFSETTRGTEINAHENIIKTVKATVTYKIGNQEKTLDLSTVIK